MWSTSLLFLLSLLGASASQPFYVDGHQHSHGFASIDDSEYVVKTFLDKMTKTIGSRDTGAISDLFADDFFFKGCKGDYDKNKVVALINKIPAGTVFSFTFKSAKYLNADKIDYSVIITGFGPNPIEAQFLLCAKTGKLSGGSVPACKRSHFHGLIDNGRIGRSFSVQDVSQFSLHSLQQSDAELVVTRFLQKLTQSLEVMDISKISNLFVDTFIFKGCKGTYNKQQVMDLLNKLPTGSKFTINLVSAKYISTEMIDYTVKVSGFGSSPLIAQFLLSATYKKLQNGSIPACQKYQFHALIGQGQGPRGLINQLKPQDIIEGFLSKMIKTVESHNETLILDLFEPDFSFKGCKAVYNREQSVAMLMFIPSGTKFSYNIKSVEDNGNGINCVLLATGLGQTAVEFDFVVSKKNQKLMSAVMPVCPIKNRFADVERPPRQIPDATEIITDFLGTLKKTLATHDSSTIGKIFDDNFVFKGCSGSYSKAETIALISKIPSESNFDFTLKPGAAWNNNGQIEYTVTVSGALRDHFDAQFVYCPYKNVLKAGSIPSCSSRRMFADPCYNLFGLFC